MSLSSRSPRVVGAHYYAKFGFDEALSQISTELTKSDSEQAIRFWKEVLDVLDKIKADEISGRHPCAPLMAAPVHNQPRRENEAVKRA